MQGLIALSLVFCMLCPKVAAVVIVGGIGIAIVRGASKSE